MFFFFPLFRGDSYADLVLDNQRPLRENPAVSANFEEQVEALLRTAGDLERGLALYLAYTRDEELAKKLVLAVRVSFCCCFYHFFLFSFLW